MVNSSDFESNIQPLTVAELIERLKESSQSEASDYCEELIRRFEPLLYLTWRRVSYLTEYQDFVQDVFLRLFKGLPHLRDARAFPGYFRQVVISVALDYLRRQKPKHYELKEAKELVNQIDGQILTGIFIRSYLEKLKPREIAILTLEYFQGYTLTDIAKQLNLQPEAVRTIKSRALSKLRTMIVDDAKALENKVQS